MNATDIGARLPDLPPEGADVEDLKAFRADCIAAGFDAGLRATLKPAVCKAVIMILNGTADRPNGQLVPGANGKTVSRYVCKIRRALNLPIETPRNARPKRTATT